VDKTFCLEQVDPGKRSKISAHAVLSKNRPTGNWYATFILQHDQQVVNEVLKSLPLRELQPAGGRDGGCGGRADELVHSDCLWFFVARCSSDMPGRAGMTYWADQNDSS
jgi:hypothetical protein